MTRLDRADRSRDRRPVPGRGGNAFGRRWRAISLAGAAALAALAAPLPAQTAVTSDDELRVCSDPNNLPFSNERQEGFENRLAELIAAELGVPVTYTWWPQRRGFVRNTLREYKCDVVMGVPTSYELVLTTRPYYRSTYVFLYRRDSGLDIHSLDDPVLREKRIGVHLVGDDYQNSPPAHALGARGITRDVIGYSVFGDYNQPNPPGDLVTAVANGDVDLAIVWGPIAGYFAKQQPVPLELVPVTPQIDLPFLPFVYDISMGVRREDVALKDQLEAIIRKKAPEIRALLEEYAVPLVGMPHRLEASNEKGENP